MGLLDRRVMGSWDYGAMGPWAIALRGKRAPFDLLPHSGKPVTARKALYDRKRRNGASLRLANPSLSPELSPDRTLEPDFGFSAAFKLED